MESLETETVLALDSVPAVLADTTTRRTIAAIAREIPAAASSHFGFESWLGDRPARLDFLFKSTPENGGRDLLAGTGPQAVPASFRDAVGWQRVEALCRAWSRPGSSLDDRVSDVWLEFDVTEGVAAALEPGLYIGTVAAPAAANDHSWLVNDVLPLLLGGTVPSEVEDCLAACVAALPPGARLYNVGVLPARRRDFLRLCVGDLPQDGLLAFLEAARWPGDRNVVAPLLRDLAAHADHIVLDFDLWDAMYASLGVEAYIWHQLPGCAERWPRLTEWLTRRGLSTPAQKEALDGWPGVLRVSGERWPRRYAAAEALTGRRSVLDRSLHHVKLSMREGAALIAKAYLSVEHRWLDVAS